MSERTQTKEKQTEKNKHQRPVEMKGFSSCPEVTEREERKRERGKRLKELELALILALASANTNSG